MVLDPIPQSLPVHFFGSRPQPPTSLDAALLLKHTTLACPTLWWGTLGGDKIYVSFAKEPHTRDDILQKRPIILRSLLIEVTPDDITSLCVYTLCIPVICVYLTLCNVYIHYSKGLYIICTHDTSYVYTICVYLTLCNVWLYAMCVVYTTSSIHSTFDMYTQRVYTECLHRMFRVKYTRLCVYTLCKRSVYTCHLSILSVYTRLLCRPPCVYTLCKPSVYTCHLSILSLYTRLLCKPFV